MNTREALDVKRKSTHNKSALGKTLPQIADIYEAFGFHCTAQGFGVNRDRFMKHKAASIAYGVVFAFHDCIIGM